MSGKIDNHLSKGIISILSRCVVTIGEKKDNFEANFAKTVYSITRYDL